MNDQGMSYTNPIIERQDSRKLLHFKQDIHIDAFIQEAMKEKLIKTNSNEYYNPNQIPVPRVTDIISKSMSNEGIVRWANYLGFNHLSYEETLYEAANYGTNTHKCIELFLNNKEINMDTTIAYESFLLWYGKIKENNFITPVGSEIRMISEYFGGTADCIMNINGKMVLIDFKTSNQVRVQYFLQLAAYLNLLSHWFDFDIDGVMILQLAKDRTGFNECFLDLEDKSNLKFMITCHNTFLGMLVNYYNLNYMEMWFKDYGRNLNEIINNDDKGSTKF